MSSHQAIKDVRKKMVFERPFLRKVRSLNNKIVRDFKKSYVENGIIISADTYRDDFDGLLKKQYDDVGGAFSKTISMPVDVAQTDAESVQIDESLSLFALVRANEQSGLITETNQKDILESLEAGIQEAQESGDSFSRVDAGAFAAIFLTRKLRGRENTIAITETQLMAETSKNTQADVLSRAGIGDAVSKVDKEWFTVGDEKVRLAHLTADGQSQDLNEPFIVDGESLNFPGDSSLGASAGNVINCRCTSVANKSQIVSKRRGL